MALEGSVEYFFPTELPSPPISTAKSLIVCCCHDKRLRVFRLLCDRFPQYLSLFSFFVVFRQNGRLFFVFLRNIPLPIEILKIKILEYSYPLSQYVNKAFIRFSRVAGRLRCVHLAEWHIGLRLGSKICEMRVRKRRYRGWLAWSFMPQKCREILYAFKSGCSYNADFIYYSHSVSFRTTTPLQDRSEATRLFDARSIGV